MPTLVARLHLARPRDQGTRRGADQLPATMSYMLLDRGAAQQVRTVAERQLVSTAQNLSKLHEQALSE